MSAGIEDILAMLAGGGDSAVELQDNARQLALARALKNERADPVMRSGRATLPNISGIIGGGMDRRQATADESRLVSDRRRMQQADTDRSAEGVRQSILSLSGATGQIDAFGDQPAQPLATSSPEAASVFRLLQGATAGTTAAEGGDTLRDYALALARQKAASAGGNRASVSDMQRLMNDYLIAYPDAKMDEAHAYAIANMAQYQPKEIGGAMYAPPSRRHTPSGGDAPGSLPSVGAPVPPVAGLPAAAAGQPAMPPQMQAPPAGATPAMPPQMQPPASLARTPGGLPGAAGRTPQAPMGGRGPQLSTLPEEAAAKSTLAGAQAAGTTVGNAEGAIIASEPEVRQQLAVTDGSAEAMLRRAQALLTSPDIEKTLGVPSYLPTWRGGSAADIEAGLDTFGASVGLNRLQELKAVGTSLGQVTQAEHELLRQSVLNVALSQSPDQFKKNLLIYMEDIRRVQARLRQSYNDKFVTPKTAPRSVVPGAQTFAPNATGEGPLIAPASEMIAPTKKKRVLRVPPGETVAVWVDE